MIDLNVILDVIENRKEHVGFSSAVISALSREGIPAFIPSHCVTTIHYRISKVLGKNKADDSIDWLLEFFDVLPEDRDVFMHARKQRLNDFEDAVVASVAELNHCNFIVTRNVSDFENSRVKSVTPAEFLQILDAMN
ncbi:MAG: PIN domain-containing protein [Ignavibacteriae bacterium]|nr:PIN domain-containing protein [Ignavibacteriota bacterium]